ncbi:Ecdysone receptor [Pseudolycoriella hygida]|uniref:Ecdysone receptor n=1 Tax=Pseudolycoriella hygida TaxID=35572 RepID=A0A9Q0SAN8_9DIPT|nr:Ecdysone receptor [Pseudolycoriella hygida]
MSQSTSAPAATQLTHLLQLKKDEYSEQNQNDDRWPCLFCGQLCKSLTGCKVHITKSHPNVNRGVIADDINLQDEIASQRATSGTVQSDFTEIIQRLRTLIARNLPNHDELEAIYKDYVAALHKCEKRLSGPEHPTRKFYRLRKSNAFQKSDRSYGESTNPQRSTKRGRDRRRAKYDRDKSQWLYFNQRRKAVHSIIKDRNDKGCMIDLIELNDDWLSSPSPGSVPSTAPPLSPSPGSQSHNYNTTMSNGYSSPMSNGSYDPYSPNGKIGPGKVT